MKIFAEKIKKFYVETHGCQMNVYDSSRMEDVLKDCHGLTKSEIPEEADVLLLNTCSIREKASEKVFSELGRWRQLKIKRPHIIIGVGGCVASQEGEAILKRAPFVDLVFGPQTLHRLGEMLNALFAVRKPIVDISFPEIEKFDALPPPSVNGPAAFVSVMEGCSKYCSFCVVPYTRGEEISRSVDSVLAEIVSLAERGIREVTLLGQNVNDYRGQLHEGGIADLAQLIRFVAAIEGIARIRFTTSHPVAFSINLMEAYADLPQLVNHLHLPVQSGSDRILAAMKRGYTSLEYKSKIRRLRRMRPDISISSDFIVGFPGETEDDFAATLSLVAEIKFDLSYSFIYSPRPGTPAAALPDQVPPETGKQRLAILQQRLMQQAREYSERTVGTSQRILVTGFAKKDAAMMTGRTENNRVVNFKPKKGIAIGDMVVVEITESLSNSLRGEVHQAD